MTEHNEHTCSIFSGIDYNLQERGDMEYRRECLHQWLNENCQGKYQVRGGGSDTFEVWFELLRDKELAEQYSKTGIPSPVPEKQETKQIDWREWKTNTQAFDDALTQRAFEYIGGKLSLNETGYDQEVCEELVRQFPNETTSSIKSAYKEAMDWWVDAYCD